MSIFDIPGARLTDLSDGEFRELIARLYEAELERQGGHRTEVRWGGRQTAADGGLDVVVETTIDLRPTPPLPRSWSGIQVKLGKMEARDIKSEMRPQGTIRPVISELAAAGGAYIIASATEDLAKAMYDRRIAAMGEALDGVQPDHRFKYDFLDQTAIARWVSAHPGVATWLRGRLGLPVLAGWYPHGRWSATPAGINDDLIVGSGVSVRLGANEPIHDLEQALIAVRAKGSATRKAIRIAGLSGVGKTRFVQALFEDDIGEEALPASQAIYCDAGQATDPLPVQMLDVLLQRGEPIFAVIDNCPPDLHGDLAKKLSTSAAPVKLITIEYDLRDDRPNETEVVRMDAEGEEITERLIHRRYPSMRRDDTQRIASLSDGNARLALALADAAPETGSLSTFADTELFDRLFWQRGQRDEELARAAGALSLVYSFDVGGEEEPHELSFLGELVELSQLKMHRHAATLVERGLAQARGHWRAVLPHALANRLATDALSKMPTNLLADHFAVSGSVRLRRSFARRLGYLHDNYAAEAVVRRWMKSGGPLDPATVSNAEILELLDRAGHLVPRETLALLTKMAETLVHDRYASIYLPRLVAIAQTTAFEPEFFEASCDLLVALELSLREESSRNHGEHLTAMFNLFLSGTLAETDQKRKVVEDCIRNDDARVRELGLEMLRNALKWGSWSGGVLRYDNSRPNAYGWHPQGDELFEWYRSFLGLATELGTCEACDAGIGVRKVVARSLRGLWRLEDLRDDLLGVSRAFHAFEPWIEGYHAFGDILFFDIRRNKDEDKVQRGIVRAEIERLKPTNLIEEIKSMVAANRDFDHELVDMTSEAFQKAHEKRRERLQALGASLAEHLEDLPDLAETLFRADTKTLAPFGEGLGQACEDPRAVWDLLVGLFLSLQPKRSDVLSGFLAAIDEREPDLAEEIRDKIVASPDLVGWYPAFVKLGPMDDRSFERLLVAVRDHATVAFQLDWLVYRKDLELSEIKRFSLLKALIDKENGPETALHALSMQTYDEGKQPEIWSPEVADQGLAALVKLIEYDPDHVSDSVDHDAARVLRRCIPVATDERQVELFAAMSAHAKKRYGSIYDFDETGTAMAEAAPARFLSMAEQVLQETGASARSFFSSGFRDTSYLANLSVDELVDWCSESGEGRWSMVAAGLDPWTTTDGAPALTAKALEFIAAAPDKASVSKEICMSIEATSRGGSRAEILESRLKAARVLLEHPNSEVRGAVAPILAEIEGSIGRIRDGERRRNEERHQSFGD